MQDSGKRSERGQIFETDFGVDQIARHGRALGSLPTLTGLFRVAQFSVARGLDDFQLLIQTLGGNRHGGAKLLREEGNLELFHHPPKGFDLALRFEGSRRLGLKFFQCVLLGGEPVEAFPVLGGVQSRALGADKQRLEITRQFSQPVVRDALQKTGRQQAGQFSGERIGGANRGR